MKSDRFLISTLVDFNDDCMYFPFTTDLLGQLMDRLHWMGLRRVYWNYWQKGMWEAFTDMLPGVEKSLENLGDPLPLARRMAHERGMEFYAVIKPFETGISHANPPGTPEAKQRPGLACIGGTYPWIDPWVTARPELRMRCRSADRPAGNEKVPVHRIQLRQRDMSPVRIKPENLEVWVSADNYGYRKLDVTFDVTETVETCPRDVMVRGDAEPVTRKGAPVRVLNLSGLNLVDPFIAVTTNFDDEEGSFRNTAEEMVRAFGPGGESLPIVVASHKAQWPQNIGGPIRDFRTGGLEYDASLGQAEVCLDVTNERPFETIWSPARSIDVRDGVIALARGRNEYLPASLCEAYPEVQEYWLDWVGQCILAGVGGVDVRISSHVGMTNTPDMYGFNEPVAVEYQRLQPYSMSREVGT